MSTASMMTASTDGRTPIPAPTKRRRRLAATAVTLGVMVAGLLGSAGAADAAVMVSTTGIVGPTREAAVPVSCNNSGLGYYITVGGPAAWARALTNGEKSQYVQWGAELIDETTGTYTYSGSSAWSLASTTSGIQFSNDVFKTHRGDTFIVEVGISWYSPSYQRVIGNETWIASQYYITDQGRYSTSC